VSRFRRFLRRPRITARLRRHRVLLPVLAVVFLALGILGLLALQARQSPSPAAPTQPSFTYASTWTLLELQRHIESGDVLAITAVETADGGTVTSSLVARARDGQLVRVANVSSAGETAAALNALGYGRLLTTEAWAAADAAGPVREPGVVGSLAALLAPILIVGVIMLVLWKTGGRSVAPPGGASSRFTTVMPDDRERTKKSVPETGAAGTSPSAREPAVRLASVAGCDEAKLELTEAIEFLKNPLRFHKLGARIPRGILLYGPPGTGKTMLAKAVATEAGVPFHYASGSEFVEKYVGVGARRMRDLFNQAKKLGRGVIFFDEFDAIGKTRGGISSHEEREQTLNQLLVEMDGFASSDDVVVIAATNRIDVLDAAVLRPGRFTRKIHVGLPDVVGRRAILAVHAGNKPLAPESDLDGIARRTYGFSGAQLADLLNEAAIFTARRGADSVSPDDLHAGWLKVAVGTGRRRSMDERERSIIAAHEVGHAICGRVHGDKHRVEEISLFAHGEALGVTVSSQEDNDLPAESNLRARLVALMGGRAAEELLFREVTGGASNDFEQANNIARQMVRRWGMGRDPRDVDRGISGRGSLSFLVADQEDRLSDEVNAAATRAVRDILDGAYAAACDTLVREMPTLRRIAAYLFEHERVDGETFDALFEGRLSAANAEGEWRAASSQPRDWGEIAGYAGQRRTPALRPLAGVAIAAMSPGDVDDATAQSDRLEESGASGSYVGGTAARATRPRMRRPSLRRRARVLATSALRHAEAWLRVPEEA
jgi:cell division protease FtsH